MANEQQSEFWSGSGGDYWVANQQQMDAMLQPLGDEALKGLNLSACQHVLDIGCGTGSTTLQIAAQLPDGARITGADISVPMTEYARQRLRAEGLANADFVTCDLQTHELAADSYDAAFSRFGVMFFDAPVTGFTNIHAGLKAGTPLAFVCWQTPAENLWHSVALQAAQEFIDMPPPPDPRAPGPFAFAEPDYVTSILEEAGFSGIALLPHKQDLQLFSGQQVREAAENYARINPIISAFVKEAGEDGAAPLIDKLAEALTPYHRQDALHFPSATWMVSARA